MSTPRSIFTNTVALFIARAGYMVGSILLVFFLSRMLQAEGLGSYSTAMALFGLAELACKLGLPNFIPRELVKDLTQTNRYLMHTGVLVTASALVAALVLVGLAPHLGYASETVIGIYLIAPALVATALQIVIGAIFITHQRVEFETFTTLFWTLLRILVSLYLLHQGHGVISLIAVFTVTSYLSLLNSIFFYVRYIDKPHLEFDLVFFRSILGSLTTFVALGVAGSIFDQCETVILSLLRGEIQVGFYAAAFKLITVWYLIPQSFMGVVFPVLTHVYHQASDKSQMIQDKSIKYLLSLALPLAIGGFVTADSIIKLFYGPGFEESIVIVRVMAWHTVLAFINNVLWRILLATDQQNLALRVQVTSGFVRVGLSLLLIPWLGALGAAWALMGGYVLYTLLHICYIHRLGVRIRFARLGWRFALAAVVMGVILFFVNPYLHLFVTILLGVVVYGVLVLVLRGFSKEDLDLFRRIWRPRSKEQDYATSHG